MRRTVPRILFWRRITPVSDVLLHADPVVPVVSSIDGPTIDGEVRLAKKHHRRPRKRPFVPLNHVDGQLAPESSPP